MAALLLSSGPAAAAGMVTKCGNDGQFSGKLAGGGTVTFNCGRKTIVLRSTKSITKNTVIDGGGRITLSGGGARRLFNVSGTAALTLKNIVLKDGSSSGNGGAIDNAGTLHLDHVRITHSKAPSVSDGGAIYTTGTVTASHSTFDNNSAGNGGAIMAFDGTHVTLTDSSLQYNAAVGTDGSGGAVATGEGATLSITRSTFTFDGATGYGGAVGDSFDTTSITIADSSFETSQATIDGGAVYASGPLTITNSTFDENGSGDSGGAVWSRGTLIAKNVTLWDNSAATEGGALYLSGTAQLFNLTVALNGAGPGNTTGTGGGIYQASGALTLHSTLVANSAESDNCDFHGAATGSFSLSTDGTCGFGAGRDSVTVKLGALETNGGPVRTMRLPRGSLAIDDGDTVGFCAASDARGVTRPKGSACDVGAFEYRPCTGKPAAPTSPAVDAGAHDNVARDVFLDWVGPDCTTTYSVVVRFGSKTGPRQFSKANLPDSGVMTSLLAPTDTYYWRVTACNAKGCVAGLWWHFTVPGA